MNTLFDKDGILNISDIVVNHPSYKTIMEDGIVTDDELKQQADAAVASLRRLQELCNEEQQSAIVDAISEMAVLFAAYHNYGLQDLCK
ncbi:MAG: hypothetical protein DBY35_12760 [Bacteroidales bacterium]|nr:MAG: hypothetical protein DBY35_12760 [Bacteroidales bacterium]